MMVGVAAVGGCSIVSPDRSVEATRVNAERMTNLRISLPPDQACAKTARMLMWCAGGLGFHYRCDSQSGNARSELNGTMEQVVRTEYFLVVEFLRGGSDTQVTVRQRDALLLTDYGALIDKYFQNKSDCQPR
ncbi:hypothetical protein A6A04_01990 [Paramagnetospirillum marisnigri]|uniref:Uncharacterized protein n=1 Tax=Paramagnetospirillum marisnigri TaxID=1285242 RepID=A0A178MN55_9PROT|nr:hypothetical protein A6A04_01990 [Paramagnetospirillum marisnigri]